MSDRFDQEKAREWNREPGIVIVPDSNYARYMEKFEQFPSKYGSNPGNPYRYRPFPKMVYRAELWQGKPVCLAAPPDPYSFPNPNDYHRAEEAALRFTRKCQRVVQDERELQIAFEEGFREGPAEAVEHLQAKMRAESTAAAERNHADRNMSDRAKAEAAEAVKEAFDAGHHLGAVPEKKRRGRPPKQVA